MAAARAAQARLSPVATSAVSAFGREGEQIVQLCLCQAEHRAELGDKAIVALDLIRVIPFDAGLGSVGLGHPIDGGIDRSQNAVCQQR